MIQLHDYQLDAVRRMKNGCILCGGVGSGKSRTALAYYYTQYGGDLNSDRYTPMNDDHDGYLPDLYIITTARKRDTCEWEGELGIFLLTTHEEESIYNHKVVIDSWNNIKKYKDVTGAFFIFDEDRITGSGTWVKAFLKIAKGNKWIVLSATPGDKYEDYIPVFIANGFYKNRTQFKDEHLVYDPYSKFPKVTRYLGTGRLNRLRNLVLVDMDFKRPTESHHEDVFCEYSVSQYKDICRNRWSPWKDGPIENASEYCYALRRVVNTDPSREIAILEILEKHPRLIVFYNFDYELDILRNLCIGNRVPYSEWNGHQHQAIPEGETWVYLVQYNAGAEGWNCTKTDTMVFWSQNYSYKSMVQAAGRIDRMNTPYHDLYFYHLRSRSGIDLAITQALRKKKKFNERSFYEG